MTEETQTRICPACGLSFTERRTISTKWTKEDGKQVMATNISPWSQDHFAVCKPISTKER